jgi:hypothetical protein
MNPRFREDPGVPFFSVVLVLDLVLVLEFALDETYAAYGTDGTDETHGSDRGKRHSIPTCWRQGNSAQLLG